MFTVTRCCKRQKASSLVASLMLHSVSLLVVVLHHADAGFSMAMPFVRIGAHKPLSNVAASSKSMTPSPSLSASRRFFLSALPAASYATLGGVGLAAVHLVQPVLAWKGVLLLAGCIGLPILRTLVPVLFMGGSGIIKTLGGTQAPSWITALAKDAADAVGVSPFPSLRREAGVAAEGGDARTHSGLGGGARTSSGLGGGDALGCMIIPPCTNESP
mgnify:FL=1